MQSMQQNMSASDLFALAHGTKNEGSERCHWCGSSCERKWTHDDEPPAAFTRTKSTAKCPANLWVCVGCYLFRRKRVTVKTLSGRIIDRQEACNYSWIITNSDLRVIEKIDYKKLYTILISPPDRMCLSLISGKEKTILQLCKANDLSEIRADSHIYYSINNVTTFYTIYELEEILRDGEMNGKSPGTRMLFEYLGPCKMFEEENGKRERGRPKKKEEQDGRMVSRKIK